MVERTQLIEALGDMRWGRHIAHFCEAKDDVLSVLVPYFKAGLENNEFCLCTVDEPLSAEEIRRGLGREVRNLDRYEADGRLELFPGRKFYLKDSIFDQHGVFSRWTESLNRALARGCKGMRGAGNAFWLEGKDFESCGDYENQLNDWISTQPMTMLCTHSIPSRSAAELLDLVSTHQCSITTRDRESAVIYSHGADRERDRMEGLLRQANQRVEIILDSITENFFSFSKDWRYTYLNKHAAEQVKILGHYCPAIN